MFVTLDGDTVPMAHRWGDIDTLKTDPLPPLAEPGVGDA
jgi:hypothetical protein